MLIQQDLYASRAQRRDTIRFFPTDRTQESLHLKHSRGNLDDVEINHATTETVHNYGQQTIQQPTIESC